MTCGGLALPHCPSPALQIQAPGHLSSQPALQRAARECHAPPNTHTLCNGRRQQLGAAGPPGLPCDGPQAQDLCPGPLTRGSSHRPVGRAKHTVFRAAGRVSQPPVLLRPLSQFPHRDGGDGNAGRVKGDKLLPWAGPGWGWGQLVTVRTPASGLELGISGGGRAWPEPLEARTLGPAAPGAPSCSAVTSSRRG